jgi:hypothetical protein
MMRHIKAIKEDENVRKRGKNFIYDSFGWFMFLALGWWLKGFAIEYFGENVSFSQALARTVTETGGLKPFVLFLGSVGAVWLNFRRIFKKRDGE